MKRLLAMLMCFALLMAVAAGCAKNEEAAPAVESAEPVAEQPAEEAPPAEEQAEEMPEEEPEVEAPEEPVLVTAEPALPDTMFRQNP